MTPAWKAFSLRDSKRGALDDALYTAGVVNPAAPVRCVHRGRDCNRVCFRPFSTINQVCAFTCHLETRF